MIVLNLTCHNGHAFEGWFTSRNSFDDQCGRGLVQCAQCASGKVHALPSGPRVLRHAGDDGRSLVPTEAAYSPAHASTRPVQMPSPELTQQVLQALAVMARGAENVGARFPEEARRIHYDEAPARTIRGQATPEETMELLEEGIFVLPAPVPPEGELH